MKKVIQGSIAAAAILLFAACGSGDGDSSTTTTTSGVFVDSPVGGLSYSCTSGATGLTNSSGQFTCKTGDTISFSLGNYSIGSCTIGTTVSPRTLYPSNDTAVINIAQLLQTIDADNNSSNGITIPVSFSSLDGITTTPEDASFDTDMGTALSTALVTEEDAAAHLNETLSDLGLESFQLTISDLAGKKITMANGDVLSFYSNMTYTEQIPGWGNHTGTWSVENGVLIIDVTFGVADKDTVAVEFSASLASGVTVTANTTQTGNAEVHTTSISSISNLTDDVIPPYTITYADIAGKTLYLPDDTAIYFFKNMTSTQDVAVNGTGVWSIENGVLIHDITTFTGGVQSTETTAIVFNAAPDITTDQVTFTAYETYSDGDHNDSIIPTDMSTSPSYLYDITTAELAAVTIPFNNDPIPYNVTVSELVGKTFVVAVGTLTQTIYFYDNMTYKITGVDELGLETLTGTWSVENGVVIADIAMDSTESEQRVYVFNAAPTVTATFTNYLTLAADPVKETGSITNISDIQ